MATTYYEIPLTPNAQQFFITLGPTQYVMTLIYRDTIEGGWVLDIADAAGVPIVQGIPLVTGADLLAAYPDKNFSGKLLVATDGDGSAVPTFANLGTASHVYFAVTS